MAQPFDAATLELQGSRVRDCGCRRRRRLLRVGRGHAGVSGPAAAARTISSGLAATASAWAPSVRRRYYQQVVLSPSGRRAAVQRMDTDTGNADMWVVDLDTAIASRLTLDPAIDGDPAWSPDERSLAFTSFRTRRGSAWLWDFVSGRESPLFELAASAGGSGADQQARARADRARAGAHPGGHRGRRLDTRRPEPGGPDVRQGGVRRAADRRAHARGCSPTRRSSKTSRRCRPTGGGSRSTRTSPGGWEVYVARFPEFTDKRQVSSAGGMQPRWRRDGKELFYLSLDGVMMAAAIDRRWYSAGAHDAGRRRTPAVPDAPEPVPERAAV